ncbi:hypothetical protein JT305_17300 [Salmonella enterica subsp. enterica serovar Senftenberg]|nr:hypothetical protein [Salmonella enterica subsp. enterica serovar Senftenberg]
MAAIPAPISLKPLNYENAGEKVAFSGGEFQLNADKDGNVVSLSGEAQSGFGRCR